MFKARHVLLGFGAATFGILGMATLAQNEDSELVQDPLTETSGFDRCDFDTDGDVDLDDWAMFAPCETGPGGTMEPDCLFADVDEDEDVDLGDFWMFQDSFTGPTPPP